MAEIDPNKSITFQAKDPLFLLELDESKSIKIGPYVSAKEKVILRKYIVVFAWKPSDLICVSPQLITHKLNIRENIKPVQQKKRIFSPDQSSAIKDELTQLLQANIIYEVKYPTWLANLVMVKKPSGRWRMCVDFTDLNKNCPKDCYPLPSIE